MNCYIVMQGDTYQEEKQLGLIWSPLKDKGGNVPHSWLRMTEIKEGDRVFHYVKGNIVALSIALDNCCTDEKPSQLQHHDSLNNESYIVKLTYHELDNPVNVRDHFHEISPLLPIKYSPFQEDAIGNSGYLYPCNEELVIKLLELISESNVYLTSEEQLEFAIDAIKATEHHILIPLIAETESEVKAKTRLGQQRFRKNLLPLWEGKCALCGIHLSDLLIASYAKPWKDGTNEERINPYNGVLLCRNHAALFAKGFIGFNGAGKLAISAEIDESHYEMHGLEQGLIIPIHPDNKGFFKWHKRHIFKAYDLEESEFD